MLEEYQLEIEQKKERIENELISKGIITTRKEEKEYSDCYYENLRKEFLSK